MQISYDSSDAFEWKVKQLVKNASEPRSVRSCCALDDTVVLFNNPLIGVLVILICIILFLLLLGCIKGILGVMWWPPLGMCGLGALVDLPRPLDHYQEEELANFPVQYDMIGWPVHPQTKRRTVRALSLRSEFCLNIIFFLTYPLVMVITFLTTCCFAQTFDNEDMSDAIYRKEHKIMLTECPSIMCPKNTNKTDSQCIQGPIACHQQPQPYNGESGAEEYDTQYVLNQMHESRINMRYA